MICCYGIDVPACQHGTGPGPVVLSSLCVCFNCACSLLDCSVQEKVSHLHPSYKLTVPLLCFMHADAFRLPTLLVCSALCRWDLLSTGFHCSLRRSARTVTDTDTYMALYSATYATCHIDTFADCGVGRFFHCLPSRRWILNDGTAVVTIIVTVRHKCLGSSCCRGAATHALPC